MKIKGTPVWCIFQLGSSLAVDAYLRTRSVSQVSAVRPPWTVNILKAKCPRTLSRLQVTANKPPWTENIFLKTYFLHWCFLSFLSSFISYSYFLHLQLIGKFKNEIVSHKKKKKKILSSQITPIASVDTSIIQMFISFTFKWLVHITAWLQ